MFNEKITRHLLTSILITAINMPFFYYTQAQEVESIRIAEAAYKHETIELIKLIFDATVDDYGPYNFQVINDISQARAVNELAQGKLLDMVWFATNKEREHKLLPIRIPLEMGLLGYRVCLINKNEQQKFDGISNLPSWVASDLIIGQAAHWPDIDILEYNGIKVFKAYMYRPMLKMLAMKRFDCFSRSVTEVINEKNSTIEKNLAIEQNLLFVYPLPQFIFVAKDNQRLAKRITQGFKRIQENGYYLSYIKQKQLSMFTELKLEQRQIIQLKNPNLSAETHKIIDDKSLWFNTKLLIDSR